MYMKYKMILFVHKTSKYMGLVKLLIVTRWSAVLYENVFMIRQIIVRHSAIGMIDFPASSSLLCWLPAVREAPHTSERIIPKIA